MLKLSRKISCYHHPYAISHEINRSLILPRGISMKAFMTMKHTWGLGLGLCSRKDKQILSTDVNK